MRLTIIREDDMIYVDKIGVKVDCSSLPSNVHAIQWNDSSGTIEFVDNIKPPETITDISEYQSYIDAWNIAYNEQLERQTKRLPNTSNTITG